MDPNDAISEVDRLLADLGAAPAPQAAAPVMAAPMATAAPTAANSLAAALGPKPQESGWGKWLASRAGDVFGGVALAGGGLIDLGLAAPTFLANRVGADLPYFPTSEYIGEGWPQTMQTVGLEPSSALQTATSWMFPLAKAAKGAQVVGGAVGYGTSELAKALAPESALTQVVAPIVTGTLAQKAAGSRALGVLAGNKATIDNLAAERVANILTPEQKTTLAEALQAGENISPTGAARTLAGVVPAPNVAAAQAAVGQSAVGQPIISEATDLWKQNLDDALRAVGFDVNRLDVEETAAKVLAEKQAKIVAGQQLNPETFGIVPQKGELAESVRSMAQSQLEQRAEEVKQAAETLGIPTKPIDQAATGKALRSKLEKAREKAKAVEQTYWQSDKINFAQPIDLQKFAVDTLETLSEYTPDKIGPNSSITELKKRLVELAPDAEGNVVREGTVKDYKELFELAFNAKRDKSNFKDTKLLGRVSAIYNKLADFNFEVSKTASPEAKQAIQAVNEARSATKAYYEKWGRGAVGQILATKGGEFQLAAEKVADALLKKTENVEKLVRDFGGKTTAPPIIGARKELLSRLNRQVAPDKFLAENKTLFKTLFGDEFEQLQRYATQKQALTGFEQYQSITDSMIPRKVFADETSVRNFVDAFGGLEDGFYIEAAKGTILGDLLKQSKGGSLVETLQQNENKLRLLFQDQFNRLMRAAQVHDEAKAVTLKEALQTPEAAGRAITDSDVQEWLQKVFVGKVIKEGKQTVATGGPRGFQEALSQRMGVAEVLYKEGDLSQLQSTLDDLQRFDDVKSLAKQSALGGSPTNLWSTVLGALKDPGGFIKMVSKAGTAVSTGSALYTVANLWKGDLPKVAKGIVSLVGGAGMSALAKTRADQLAKAEAMIFANPKLLEAALAPPTEENVQRFIKSLEAMGVLTAKAGANTTREESKQNAAAQEPAKPIASMEPKATGAQTNSDALLKEIMDMAIPSAGAEERQPTAASTTVKGTNVTVPTGQSYAPPSLVKAVIQAESRGRPYAVSKKGAGGLMQLMPQTAKALGINPADRFDPQTNVEAGSRYLKQMLDRFGSYELALAAYNFGPTAVAKRLKAVEQDNKKPTWNNIKHLVPAETRAYVANVTKNIG